MARMTVGAVMLIMAFIGMIITDVRSAGGWNYWKWTVGIYALLALWLSWYVKRQTQTVAPFTILHEVLHWAGVIGAVFTVSLYVKMGLMSRFAAALFDLNLMALGIFLAGVYIETSFLIIGLALFAMALSTGFLNMYLYALLIPITIVAALAIWLLVWRAHKKFQE